MPLRVWLVQLASSAPKAVTTTQCGVVCSRPPPAQSGGTRRPTVRSRSLAALHAIVCSYLLPGEWRLRSAPASLCRVMAQAAWPSGAASQKHGRSEARQTAAGSPKGETNEVSESITPAANRQSPRPTAQAKPIHAARGAAVCRPFAVAVMMFETSSTAVSLRSARHQPPCAPPSLNATPRARSRSPTCSAAPNCSCGHRPR